jgi:uncharacterized RDD family membrane protein YckC
VRRESLTIVTPEHVLVEVFPAGLGSRFIALTIDLMLTVAVPMGVVSFVAAFLPGGVAFALQATLALVVTFAYHLYYEVRRQGRTIGKSYAGIRVVDDRGLPLTFPQSLIRNVLRAIDGLPLFYGVGAISVLVDPRHRRLGDIAARTLVIEEVSPARQRVGSAISRRFEALSGARTMRLIRHRIGLEERELINDLVLRSATLEPHERFEIMKEIGSYYRELLEIDLPTLSDENLIRALAEILGKPGTRPRTVS